MNLQELREIARRREDAIKAAVNAKDNDTRNRHTKAAAKDSERLFAGILDQLDETEEARADQPDHGNVSPEEARMAIATMKTSTSTRSDSPARRTLDRLTRSGLLPDHGAEVAENLILSGPEASKGVAARWAQVTGDEHYASAFAKLVADPDRGHMMWSPEEQNAFKNVQEYRAQTRAMDSTVTSGGTMLPLFLDPAILLTSDGSLNPLRQISRVVQTTSNSWNGVTSAGVTAEWLGENVESADGTPTLATAEVPVYKGSAFVPFSYEVEGDALDFAKELAKLLVDASDQLQATAFTTGGGITGPTGFITALGGTASEVAPTVAESFTAEDVYALQSALPARFQQNAKFACAIPTANKMAQFETTAGARLFPEIATGSLLRRSLSEISNMGSVADINIAVTGNNRILAYGDFNQFVIADRIGSTIELVPHIFGANHRPTGTRGFHLWFRTGSDVVVPEAFRLLNVATTL